MELPTETAIVSTDGSLQTLLATVTGAFLLAAMAIASALLTV
jgi:hypothetical protein